MELVQIRDITQLPESSGEVQFEHTSFGKDSLLECAYKHYERWKRRMKDIYMKHDDRNQKLSLNWTKMNDLGVNPRNLVFLVYRG